MMVQLLFLTLLFTKSIFFVLSLHSCTGPVTFNSTDFTIRGPCPNDTVLAPVGSTVHYRCDIEDRSGDIGILPYWHIPGLTGTPFLNNKGSEHDISVSAVGTNGMGVGTADLIVTIKEQYLTDSLTIQCGACSVLNCGNALSENITSTNVVLVAFDVPRNLSSIVIEQTGTVTLYWSTPLVSTGYTSVESVGFEYVVNVTDTTENTHSMQTFVTTTNQLTLSRLNITTSLKCREYSWSVAASVDSGEITKHVNESNISFILQNEPTIIGNPSFEIKFCNNISDIIVQLNVSTFQPLDTLQYIVCILLHDYTELWVFTNENMTIDFKTNIVLKLNPPIESDDMGFISVSVSNECGRDESKEYQLNFQDEDVTPQLLSTSSLLPTNSLSTIRNSLLVATVSNEGVMASDSRPISLIIAIVSGVCGGLVFFLLIFTVIIIILVISKKKRSKSIDIKNDNINPLQKDNIHINFNDAQTANKQSSKVAVSNYLTPTEAIEEFKANSSTAQYCEPEKLRNQHALQQLQESGACHPDHCQHDLSMLMEMPGYSEPIANTKRGTIKSNNNNGISTNNNHSNHSEATQHTAQQGEEKHMYADVAEIKANKESKPYIPYAVLDLQTTNTGSSEPLSPKQSSSVYSTIKDC